MDVEQQAKEMGWKPQDQYKGPAEKWVDAAEYVRRGEEVLPIVRNENRRLHETVTGLNGTIAQLQAALAQSQESMNEFREFQAEMLQTKLKEQRVAIQAQIRAAREAGEDARLIELEEQLDENRDAARAAKEAPKPAVKPAAQGQPAQLTPEQQADYNEWASRNDWVNGDSAEAIAKQGAAFQFGQLAARKGLTGKAFFDEVDRKLAEAFPEAPRSSKVEGARPGGGGGGGGGNGKTTFAALPPDAKAYAESKVNQFVGPNKMFKTADEWKTHYAKVYFQQEQEA